MLDTNVLISLFRNPNALIEALREYDTVILSTIVIGEFRAGLSNSKRDREIEEILNVYLKNPAVQVVPISAKTTFLYANIFRHLKTNGHPIPQNDIWIAANALEYATPLFTFDSHFSVIPMLQFVN